MDVNIQVIARMHSDFATKFGIPRQSGLVEELRSTIVFEPEFRNPDALRGIEEFSHLWIIWQFSEAVRQGWSPTVRPPRLGGNTRMGVFATRSPFRPNNLGLSSVGLLILNSLLVLPAASARNISRNLKEYHGFSVLFALIAGMGGLTVSYYLGCSAGASISLILAGIFAVTFSMRKGRA